MNKENIEPQELENVNLEKVFTQEEVDTIINERLQEEIQKKHLEDEEALSQLQGNLLEKEKEIEYLQAKSEAEKWILSNKYNPKLLECIDCTSIQKARESIELIKKIKLCFQRTAPLRNQEAIPDVSTSHEFLKAKHIPKKIYNY